MCGDLLGQSFRATYVLIINTLRSILVQTLSNTHTLLRKPFSFYLSAGALLDIRGTEPICTILSPLPLLTTRAW